MSVTGTRTSVVVADEDEFRRRVRHWLEANIARRPLRGDAGAGHGADETQLVADITGAQAALFDAGLAGLTWPAAYGGAGLTTRHQEIYDEEAAVFDVPRRLVTIGLGMCGPTILAHGTEAQKRRYLRPLLRGDEIWCQLFSEPNAGSDLAAVQTRAVREGENWVLTGQKVWSSVAHHAHFGICLARTNPDLPKHEGLTMFIVDLRAPGVTVRPLRQMDGAANFNEVFLDGVTVGDDGVLGRPGGGWTTAITTLMNERSAVGEKSSPSLAGPLVELARATGVASDPAVRQQLALLHTREAIQGFVRARVRAARRHQRAPGPEGSIGKLSAAQLQRLAAQVAGQILGPRVAAWAADDAAARQWATLVLGSPSLGIAGGTDEVQRNIIAERVLGLPREPQVDRGVPFRDLLANAAPRPGAFDRGPR